MSGRKMFVKKKGHFCWPRLLLCIWSAIIPFIILVGCATPPPSPTLTPELIEGENQVSGYARPKASINVLVNGQSVAKGSATDSGEFVLDVPSLSVSQVVTATQSSEGLTSVPSAPVVVQKTILVKMTLQPEQTLTLEQGGTHFFSATGTFSNGKSEHPLTEVIWQSSQPTIVSIDSKGQIAGMKAGTAEIWGSRENIETTHTVVHIKPVPPQIMEPLRAGDSAIQGQAEPLAKIQIWVNETPRGGEVSADEQGRWQINRPLYLEEHNRISATQAVAQHQSDPSNPIIVGPPRLMEIAIDPGNSVTLSVGQDLKFTASGTYSDGNLETPLSGASWGIEDSSVATIDDDGTATGMKPGRVWIQVHKDDLQSDKTMLVVEPVPPTITTSPRAGDTAVEGTAGPLANISLSINGVPQDVNAVADNKGYWKAEGVTPLTEHDEVTSRQTVNGIPSSSSSTVIVGRAVLTQLEIQPSQVMLEKGGQSQSFAASGIFSDGEVEQTVSNVTWSVEDTRVATINPEGIISGIEVGTTIVQVSRDDINSSPVTVIVNPPPPVITSKLKAGDTSVSGTAEPSARIQILLDGETLGGQVLADAFGQWEIRHLPSLERDDGISVIQTVNDLNSQPSPVETVLPNHPPVLEPIEDQIVYLGGTLTLSIKAHDPENDELTYNLVQPSVLPNSILDVTTGQLTFTPLSDQLGAWDLKLTVSDGNRATERTIAIKVALPQNLIVLLDNTDGTVGMIEVTNAGVTRVLDQPAQAVGLVGTGSPPSEPFVLKEENIQSVFKESLEAKPEDPLKFILYFKTDTIKLSAESEKQLPEILLTITNRKVPDIEVIGHTDRTASAEYNHQLSLRRANAIRDMLVAKGIDPQVVHVTGHGENNPLVETPDDVSEPLNRRVEIIVR